MITLQQFFDKYEIYCSMEEVNKNPNNLSKYKPEHSHFKVVLTRSKLKKRSEFIFSMVKKDIKAYDVYKLIGYIAYEARNYERAKHSLDNWVKPWGFNHTNELVIKRYDWLRKEIKKLKEFLGNLLYEELMMEVSPVAGPDFWRKAGD